jgi:hypothetical protein
METNHERHAQATWEKEVTIIQLPVHQIWAGFFEDWKERVSWKVNLFNGTAFECRCDLVKIYRSNLGFIAQSEDLSMISRICRSIWRFIAQSRLIP